MPRETLYTVQALRCVAALAVVVSHAADLVIPHDKNNALFWCIPWTGGVDLFFVISGFIMLYLTHDAFGKPGAAHRFLGRRIVRIVPSYWFFTTLTVIAVAVAGGRLKGTTIHWQQLVTSYGFIPWPRDDGAMVPIVGQGWTLNYEMLFYGLFAFALLSARGLSLLCLALLGLVLMHGLYPVDWHVLRFWSEPIVLEFLGGMMLAKLYLAEVRLPPVATAAMIGLGVAAFALGDDLGLRFLGRAGNPGIPALLVCAGIVLTPQPQIVGRGWRAIGAGGDASYALYLAHYLIVNAVILGWKHLAVGLPWLGVLAAIVVSCVAAILFHILLERPVVDWLRKRIP